MALAAESSYVGTELSLFAGARVWAGYLAAQLSPYVRGTVFEVGAGLGTRTRDLSPRATRWLALEPDAAMARHLAAQVESGALPAHVEAFAGPLSALPQEERADAILYIDVLEHIERDAEELALAALRLKPGGHLVVLSPAHQWLFSEFDRAIGHFRRYSKRGLTALGPPGLVVERRRMLDAAGLAASAANRFLLRKAAPTRAQIRLWDRGLVRLSKALDPASFYLLGKSVLVVWRRP